jgi:hypothetical protein
MNNQANLDPQKEATDWLSNFPKLFDLYKRSKKDNSDNYFDLKEFFPIAYLGAQAYAELESYLARLDDPAWERLCKKALPYVSVDDPTRRYQQLFSFLDEARGYAFLADEGYTHIEFVEQRGTKKNTPKSPDLFARKQDSTAILEVKTINESDDSLAPDAPWRHVVVTVRAVLSDELKNKLLSTIEEGRNQLESYPHLSDRKIIFLVVRLDHGQKTAGHLYTKLKDFVAAQSMRGGVEVYCQVTV